MIDGFKESALNIETDNAPDRYADNSVSDFHLYESWAGEGKSGHLSISDT